MTIHEKPIGYWLKRCHDLLDCYIDAQQASNGIDRLDWQILNVLEQTGKDECRIHEKLEPFASPETISSRVSRLQERGLIDFQNKVTESGRESFHALASVQNRIRDVVSSGITKEEYESAVNVLKKIAGNLERAGA